MRDRAVGSDRIERLSPLDLSNLRVETRGAPMHVAALALLEGTRLLDEHGALRQGKVRDCLEARLPLAPRLRQVLYRPCFGLGPPLWVDDPRFDIRAHVRTRTVPAPGDEASLLRVCAQLNEPPLDRSRPLWQIWLLPGLADGNVGLLLRLHHAVADGLAALALIGALLDPAAPAPDPPTTAAARTRAPNRPKPHQPDPESRPWSPRPRPGPRELFAENLRRHGAAVAHAARALTHPTRSTVRLRALLSQGRRLRAEGRAPALSVNRPVGRHRRVLLLRADLGDLRAAAHRHRATVNDVVLTAVAAGARGLLQARGELRPGLTVKVSVAVSVRTTLDERAGGNRVGVMLVPLPLDEADPVRVLARIATATASRKRLPPYLPMARFAQRWMVRAMPRQRLVNLFTSNLPGPQTPMSIAGARIRELFQLGVVQGNVPISVGVISYAGRLEVALVGDARLVPDLDVFAAGMSYAWECFAP
ncbi:wax ester/triacylglycerol synthase family O-acyltransferase [Streptomyces sp. NPDC005931]|uniref:wax ester/triacylglycerol synthase family O-acyltransferase n=1 Tax=Streptomyces sp. NPDC005931 TaxID=3364737 RepID=UPI003696E5A2